MYRSQGRIKKKMPKYLLLILINSKIIKINKIINYLNIFYALCSN